MPETLFKILTEHDWIVTMYYMLSGRKVYNVYKTCKVFEIVIL